MKNKRASYILGLLTIVAIGAIGCSHPGSSDSGSSQAAATTQTPQQMDLITAASSVSDSAETDSLNTMSAAMSPVAVVSVGNSLPELPPCISLDPQSTNVDKIYDVNCNGVSGTIEFKSLALHSIDVISNLNAVNASGDKDQLSSSIAASQDSDGEIAYSRQFDDKIQTAYSQFEISGNSAASFTPDDASNPSNGGDIDLSGAFDYVKNSVNLASYSVASQNLHVSACGLDSGSIEFKNKTDDLLITIQACGQRTIILNGVPVSLPK